MEDLYKQSIIWLREGDNIDMKINFLQERPAIKSQAKKKPFEGGRKEVYER